MHNATLIWTMAQKKDMAEFMDRFFQNPLIEQNIVLFSSIEFWSEPEGRYDRLSGMGVGLTEEEV